MAPTSSKPLPEQRPLGVRKRFLAATLASTDNVDPDAVKRRKLEEATSAERQRRQPSVELIVDNNDLPSHSNFPPMNASRIIEAADGSDDDLDDVQMVDGEEGDVDSLPGLEPVDSSECGDNDNEEEDEDEDENETEDAELCKHTV